MSAIEERLAAILGWYEHMISERTGRLVYVYNPEEDLVIEDGNPIRDIAAVWDMELLTRFLGRPNLLEAIKRSLRYYRAFLVPHGRDRILDPRRLGEPSSIAHSAFMLLALVESDVPARRGEVMALADAILAQQRQDGSYRIFFGGEEDAGLEFYPGEAMLALMHASALTHEGRYLASVERGFAYYSHRFSPYLVDNEMLVFYANWQSQYATHLDARAKNYIFLIYDRIIASGFIQDIETHPHGQVTVEVACALEGMTEAYAAAVEERDHERMAAYEHAIRVMLHWLFRAQRIEHAEPREQGGFGHSLTDRTQRIDVTGHVVEGFIKSAQNGIALDA